MPGCGMHVYIDVDRYEAGLRQAHIEFVVTPHGEFKNRLTWIELHSLQLLYCEENFPNISLLSLPSNLVFIAFPQSGPMPLWNGMQIRVGEVALLGLGRQVYQSTPALCGWSVIAAKPEELENAYEVLTGKRLALPLEGRVLRPARQDAARLRRLHARAQRLAENKPKLLTHVEVARAIEQSLLQVLITCLTAAEGKAWPYDAAPRCHLGEVMEKLEKVIAKHLDQPLGASDLCRLVGVSDPILRMSCDTFLGISPVRYVQLRRMKQIRIALRDADPAKTDAMGVAEAHGITDFKRFERLYQAVFGQSPSIMLRRTTTMDFGSA